MPIMDDIKQVASSVEQISSNGANIVQSVATMKSQDAQSLGAIQSEDTSCTLTSTSYMSNTVKLVWGITLFSMVLFIMVVLCDVIYHVNVSYVLTYDVGVWTPMLITYATKSYFEKKNNVPNADLINNGVTPVIVQSECSQDTGGVK